MKWDKLRQQSLNEIIDWAANKSWAKRMSECNQDAQWHAEGDVWTHTKMVCDQLPQLEEWGRLNEHEKTVLIFTALFHDIGKPITSAVDPETGHLRSPKHALKGEHIARSILRELDCDLSTREEIARMVRFHGRPAFLLEKPNPIHEVVSLSWLVNNKLLFLFALADTRGRKTKEMSRPEDNLHLWKMTAEDNNCFDTPYPFANPHARFLFYRMDEPSLFYVPHEKFSCTATILSGFPGCGKDTWLAENRENLPVVSLDSIRTELGVAPTDNQGSVVQLARERCREYLRVGKSFAFNATNLLRSTRKRWIDLFADYRANIEMVYIEPRWKTILKQNKNRERPVPESVISNLANKCEPPTLTETHELIFTED